MDQAKPAERPHLIPPLAETPPTSNQLRHPQPNPYLSEAPPT